MAATQNVTQNTALTSMTFGQMLACADAHFAANGGYKATADCEARRVDLILQQPDGACAVISSAPLPHGVAPEDVAHRLLSAEIGEEQAEARYFVITVR